MQVKSRLSSNIKQTAATPIPAFLTMRSLSSNAFQIESVKSTPNLVPLPEHMFTKPYLDAQLSEIVRPYYENKQPVKLYTQHNAQTYNHRAQVKWSDLDYLREAIGTDYPCDVEIMGDGKMTSTEKLTVPFDEYAEYLRDIEETFEMLTDDNMIARQDIMYMAQNDIPRTLIPDITIPGFCTDASHQLGNGRLYNTMIWIGPRRCISKLHYDPLDNMLMQIIGSKRVFLVDSTVDTDLIYVDTTLYQQHNMSAIDDFGYELQLLNSSSPSTKKQEQSSEYTNLLQVPTIYETVLHPGDLLYIPQKYWHAAESLEYSISVNAWWR